MNSAISLYKNLNSLYNYCVVLAPFRIFYNINGDTKSPKVLKDNGNREIPEYIITILKKFYQANHHYIIDYQLMNPLKKGFYFDKGAQFIDVLLTEISIQKGLVATELIDNNDFFKNQKDMQGKSIKILLDNNLIPDTATPIHELFHVFQYNYCNFNNMWFMEGLARWSQNITHERVNIYETLPSTTDELNYLISRAHDAEYFWRELISKCGNTIDFVRILLEQSALQEKELEKKFNLVDWSKENKKSSLNNEYIFKAIIKTIEILQIQPDEELQSFIDIIKVHKSMIRMGTIYVSNLSEHELKELESVEEIDGDLIIDSTNISSLNNFNRLKKVNTIKIVNNKDLLEILGFNALENVKNIEISSNMNLERIYGFIHFFTNINKIDGYLKIESNKKLENILFLKGLSYVGSSFYLHHNNLSSLHGLEDLIEVNASLSISSNKIKDLLPLSNLKTVDGMLGIAYNELTSLNGLDNLEALSAIKWGDEYRSLAIQGNKNLEDISSLKNVKSITNNLIIHLDKNNDYSKVPEQNSHFYNQNIKLIADNSDREIQSIFPLYNKSTKPNILFTFRWKDTLSKIDYIVPHFTDINDIDSIIKQCKKYGIDTIFPQIVGDQFFTLKNQESLNNAGIYFIANSPYMMDRCVNKRDFYEFMIESELETYIPTYYKNLDEIKYPAIIKRETGWDGQNMKIIYDAKELPTIEKNEVVCEYITSNTEYATNIIYKNGVIIQSATYKRINKSDYFILNTDSGNEFILDKIETPFIDIFSKILSKLDIDGNIIQCCFDYKIVDNNPKIFEINARLGKTLYKRPSDLKPFIDLYLDEVKNLKPKKIIYVFAPHADDETLACGGTIIKKVQDGYSVKVVVMTDGRGFHKKFTDSFSDELIIIREDEALRATKILGVNSENVIFFKYPDGFLSEYKKETEEKILSLLKADLNNIEEIYIPHIEDKHKDHKMTNKVVLNALSVLNYKNNIFTYNVWGVFNGHNFTQEVKVDIKDVLELKKKAIDEYKSQINLFISGQVKPVLSKENLDNMTKNYEIFYKIDNIVKSENRPSQFINIKEITSTNDNSDPEHPLRYLIEGIGVGFDKNPPYGSISRNAWSSRSASQGFKHYFEQHAPVIIDIKLSQLETFDAISIWSNRKRFGNSIKEFTLEFSDTGASLNLSKPVYEIATEVNPFEIELFKFSKVTANFIRLTILSNHHEVEIFGDCISFQEIAVVRNYDALKHEIDNTLSNICQFDFMKPLINQDISDYQYDVLNIRPEFSLDNLWKPNMTYRDYAKARGLNGVGSQLNRIDLVKWDDKIYIYHFLKEHGIKGMPIKFFTHRYNDDFVEKVKRLYDNGMKSFVVKMSHLGSSKGVFRVKNGYFTTPNEIKYNATKQGEAVDFEYLSQQIALHWNHKQYAEDWRSVMIPAGVILEAFIEDTTELKVSVIFGKAVGLFIEKRGLPTFDIKGNLLTAGNETLPFWWKEAITQAEKVAKIVKADHVRIDLFYNNGEAIVNEITWNSGERPENYKEIAKHLNYGYAYRSSHIKGLLNATKNTTFSVIVTAYNIQEYIFQALDSVLRQTYPAFEIIVIDDGSTDATFKLATKKLEGIKNSKVIKQENRGPGGARNKGIAAAIGDYIVFLDGDDWLIETALSVLKSQAESHPDAIFCNRTWFHEKESKYESDIVFTKTTQGEVASGRELLRRYAVPAKAFKREFLIINQILFPEKMVWEDYPFSYNVLAKAQTINVATEVIYVARKRDGNNESMTQKKRLGEFFLQSRFRQIDMDREIISNSHLSTIFKGYDFNNLEFETRLMMDIKYLARETDIDILTHAIKRFKSYIHDNKKLIFSCVSTPAQKIYKAILKEDFSSAIIFIRKYYEKN
ncbi:MAG: glycosyltransferase [Campylobacterales bacterium]|nr:glycosyltransferase [Campylobacterales bacterium]